MSNKLYIIISLLILSSIYLIFRDHIFLCSDHNNYFVMIEILKGSFDVEAISRIGIDSLIYIIYLFNKNIAIDSYFLLLTLLPVFVYLVAIFILKNNLKMTNVFLLISAPFIFSITFGHFWTCGYRQGLSTSFLILFYAILNTLEKRNWIQNSIILFITFLLGLLSHWSFLLIIPLFLFGRFIKILRYLSNLFKKRKFNLVFLLIILTTGILVISSFTLFRGSLSDNLQYLLEKSENYGLENTIGAKGYGTRFGIVLLVAYSPYILIRSLFILKTTKLNLYLKDQFIITLFFYIICIFGSVTGVGSFIRILVPLQLISVINIIINMRNYPKLLFLSSLLLMTVLATANVYYLYTRLLTYTPV